VYELLLTLVFRVGKEGGGDENEEESGERAAA